MEARKAAAEREQRQVVDGLAQGLTHLADGDLTFRLSEMKLFFESRYHDVFSGLAGGTDARFVNLTLGVRLGR